MVKYLIDSIAEVEAVPLPRFLSLNDMMRLTSLSRSAIYRLIQSKQLKRLKIEGKTVFLESDYRIWAEQIILDYAGDDNFDDDDDGANVD